MKREVMGGIAVGIILLGAVALAGNPDLIISSITMTNTSAHVGETIRFIDVTKNLTNICTANFHDRIYLCQNSNAISQSCYWTNHTVTVGLGLGAGQSKTYTNQFKIPNVASGTWFICDVADGSNNVLELNENNNTNSVPIIILNP